LLLSFQPLLTKGLKLIELDLGQNVPIFHQAYSPRRNEQGCWVDLDVEYEGTICFTMVAAKEEVEGERQLNQRRKKSLLVVKGQLTYHLTFSTFHLFGF
jgi:hypothetical protein